MKPLIHLMICSMVCAACSKSSDQPAATRRRDAGRAAAPTSLDPSRTPVPAGSAVMHAMVTAKGGGNCDATIDDDCRQCLLQKSGDASLVPQCEAVQGNAKAGPAVGTPRSQLCKETLDCVRRTKCHSLGTVDCYCGTAIDHGTCYATKTEAAGACKKEFDRSLEIPTGSTGYDALKIITEPETAGGIAAIIATFENTQCVAACLPYIATACE